MAEKLSRETKRGLFWDGGNYAKEKATNKKYRAEAQTRVTRGQALGSLGGLAAGGMAGAGVGAALGGGPGALAGGYVGGTAGAIAGASHGGKRAYRHLRAEGKVKKNFGGVSAFGIEH